MIVTTACSSGWYPRLLGMLGSLYANNYDLVERILVHDIGLSQAEHNHVASMDKVEMCGVPMVNPQVLTPLVARQCGDPYLYVGLMTWKPAILKQTLENYEHALWLDSGVTAWGRLDKIWNHILQTGHFFVGCGKVGDSITTRNRERLNVEPEILEAVAINAGIMGYSRAISESVVDPCYEWAKDITLFIDDGTAPGGPTAARHEQTLISILAARAGLERQATEDITLCDGTVIRITDSKFRLDEKTALYHSRGDTRFYEKQYARYKT